MDCERWKRDAIDGTAVGVEAVGYGFCRSRAVEKWEHKTRHFNREMDVTVEQAVQAGTLPDGADILDLMLKDAEKSMK